MKPQIDLCDICARIASMKQNALELKSMGGDFPCLIRNADRILASLKMLEIDFCDVLELERSGMMPGGAATLSKVF